MVFDRTVEITGLLEDMRDGKQVPDLLHKLQDLVDDFDSLCTKCVAHSGDGVFYFFEACWKSKFVLGQIIAILDAVQNRPLGADTEYSRIKIAKDSLAVLPIMAGIFRMTVRVTFNNAKISTQSIDKIISQTGRLYDKAYNHDVNEPMEIHDKTIDKDIASRCLPMILKQL